jgi:uncharacterized protein
MRSVLRFFLLTYVVSWIFFVAAAAISAGNAAPLRAGVGLSGFVLLLGVFAPSLVALALTSREEGRDAVQALLRRTLLWRVGARWYVFAVGYMAAIKLAVALVHRVATGAWPAFGPEALYVMIAGTAVSTPVQAGEEIGWRGYALPRLAGRLGLGPASLVLGVVWACWHLPFFFIAQTDAYGQSFPMYLLSVTAISVAMTWLYWRTSGSLLLTMLLHAAINNTKDLVPSAPLPAASPFTLTSSLVARLTATLLWVCAVYFLVQMRSATLQSALDNQ